MSVTTRYLWRQEQGSPFAADTWTDALALAREKRRDPFLDQSDPGLVEWLLRAAIITHLRLAGSAATRARTLLWVSLAALLAFLVDNTGTADRPRPSTPVPAVDPPVRMLAGTLTVASNAPGAAA